MQSSGTQRLFDHPVFCTILTLMYIKYKWINHIWKLHCSDQLLQRQRKINVIIVHFCWLLDHELESGGPWIVYKGELF